MAAPSETRDPNTVIPPARFHHVVFKTRNLAAMKEFYSTLIGTDDVANLTMGPVQGSFTTYDEANHRVAFFGADIWAGEVAPANVGLHHIAYEYDALADLVHTYRRMLALGHAPVWTTDHGPTISFYFYDPDGNQVELQVDNFPDEPGKSKEFMRHDEQYNRPNYPGEDIDMEQFLAAFDAGMSPAELHEKSWAGEFRPAVPVGPPGM